jgi:YHS domain-containing protein
MEPKEEKRTVKDPVCGMELEQEMAYSKTVYAGKTFYFCSKQCEENFKKNPEKYTTLKLEKKPETLEHHH